MDLVLQALAPLMVRIRGGYISVDRPSSVWFWGGGEVCFLSVQRSECQYSW